MSGGRVCMVDWAQQPDLLMRCDGAWETPEWKQPELPPGVHLATNGRRYTFEPPLVTCTACLQSKPRAPEGGRP